MKILAVVIEYDENGNGIVRGKEVEHGSDDLIGVNCIGIVTPSIYGISNVRGLCPVADDCDWCWKVFYRILSRDNSLDDYRRYYALGKNRHHK